MFSQFPALPSLFPRRELFLDVMGIRSCRFSHFPSFGLGCYRYTRVEYKASYNGSRYRSREGHMHPQIDDRKNKHVSRCFMQKQESDRVVVYAVVGERINILGRARARGLRAPVKAEVPCWHGDFEFSYASDHSYRAWQEEPDFRSPKNFRFSHVITHKYVSARSRATQ